MNVISLYEEDRNALTDCLKLANSGLLGSQSFFIYGFDFGAKHLDPAVQAFEIWTGCGWS